MTGAVNRVAVEVGELRKGMYVTEPDRPWVELPLPFAGFVIESDEELETLQRYCAYVYIDVERSVEPVVKKSFVTTESAEAPETLEPVTKPAEQARPARDQGIDESRRYIDPDKLKPQVEAASRTIASARSFLEETFSGASEGKGVDVNAAQSTINDLIVRITQNPTASLLLTSLSDRDSFTTTHSVHVCVLSLAFCMRSQLDERQLEILGLGTLLHDVGKARLPKELINRAGPLTDDEWELVKRHPIVSHDILADSGKVPRAVLKIARMHHERCDGKGYPYGLTRKELPGYVLVAALVNRYQSLTSDRPYRAATAADQVLRSFYVDADSLYGSRATEAFIRCVGIYPVGSLVELDNGALAVVVSSRPNARLRPTVQLVRTPDDEPYDKLVLLNLAADAERWERKENGSLVRQVRRVRSPSETGIDPGQVIAESFGVQIA